MKCQTKIKLGYFFSLGFEFDFDSIRPDIDLFTTVGTTQIRFL